MTVPEDRRLLDRVFDSVAAGNVFDHRDDLGQAKHRSHRNSRYCIDGVRADGPQTRAIGRLLGRNNAEVVDEGAYDEPGVYPLRVRGASTVGSEVDHRCAITDGDGEAAGYDVAIAARARRFTNCFWAPSTGMCRTHGKPWAECRWVSAAEDFLVPSEWTTTTYQLQNRYGEGEWSDYDQAWSGEPEGRSRLDREKKVAANSTTPPSFRLVKVTTTHEVIA